MTQQLAFAIELAEDCASAAERARLLEDPGFGRVFTDHMVTIRYVDGGWTSAKLGYGATVPAVVRNVAGGAFAMAVSYAVGALLGALVA